MLNFTTMHYVLGIWFVRHNEATPPEDRVDWLGCVYQEHPLGPWIGRYRFRYHSSPDPHDENDRKSWTTFEAPAATAEAQLLAAMRLIADMTALRNQTTPDEVLVRGPGDAAFQALQRQPWVHMRTEAAPPP